MVVIFTECCLMADATTAFKKGAHFHSSFIISIDLVDKSNSIFVNFKFLQEIIIILSSAQLFYVSPREMTCALKSAKC
jgi:hypothetical protein